MGDAANQAISLGVGIFVTLLIASGVIFIFSQMQDVYSEVSATDTNIAAQFGEYAMYDNTTVTGLEVVNCANKYYNENFVVVSYMGRDVNNAEGIQYLEQQLNRGFLTYDQKYSSIAEEVEYDGLMKTRITFTRI